MNTRNADARTWIQGQPSRYQLRDMTHFPDWGLLLTLDAFFNNLTSGLMLASTLVWAAGPPLLGGLLPVALSLAFLLLVTDLCILISDLGDPARFINSLRVMRFSSPLSVGVWGLASYGAFLSVATFMAWILWANGGGSGASGYIMAAIMRLCMVMAAMGAVVVIAYKGVVFSCSSQPGLSQARWLSPFMVSDSLLMGMSVFALLCALFSPDGAACVFLILPLIVLLCARSIAFGLLWQDVKNRARKVYSPAKNRGTMLIVYGFGTVAPLLLIFAGAGGIIVAACLVLGAGLWERFWLIALPKPV